MPSVLVIIGPRIRGPLTSVILRVNELFKFYRVTSAAIPSDIRVFENVKCSHGGEWENGFSFWRFIIERFLVKTTWILKRTDLSGMFADIFCQLSDCFCQLTSTSLCIFSAALLTFSHFR